MNYILLKISSLCLIIYLSVLIFTFPARSQATPEKPASIDAQYFLKIGIEEFSQNQFDRAIVNFTEAIKLKPKLLTAYNNRCLTNIYLENYSRAIEDCSSALQIQPNSDLAYLDRGLAYYRLGQYTKAIDDYNSVLKIKPYIAEAYYNRGLIKTAEKEYLSAIEDYDRALTQIAQIDRIQLANIYNSRGLAHLGLNHLHQAMSDLDLAVRLNADNAETYYDRACLCHRLKLYHRAIEDFTQSIALDPHYTQAYINRGLIHHQLGFDRAALKDLHHGAECLCHEGNLTVYQQTLDLIKAIQRTILDRPVAIG